MDSTYHTSQRQRVSVDEQQLAALEEEYDRLAQLHQDSQRLLNSQNQRINQQQICLQQALQKLQEEREQGRELERRNNGLQRRIRRNDRCVTGVAVGAGVVGIVGGTAAAIALCEIQ